MSIAKLSKPVLIAGATTIALSALGGYVWREEHRPSMLEIYVFALKSGRSMLVRTPDDQRVLVDGGSNSEVIRHLSSVLPFYSRRIDAVISTGTDGKNASGLVDVLERYDVGRAYIPATTLQSLGLASSTDAAYEVLLDVVAAKHVRLGEIGKGDSILKGKTGASIDVLFPAPASEFEYSKASPPDMVLKISYGNNSILVANAASIKMQKHIAFDGNLGRSDVLVVSHSAAAANMSQELMDAVRPERLVYDRPLTSASRTVTTKAQKQKPAMKRRQVPDPLASILDQDRFNLRGGQTVRIVSDGMELSITKDPD